MTQAHQKLVVWQRADDLCLAVHRLTRESFPREERFELAAQLRRAAYSVGANIVEGVAYHTPQMRLKHLRVSAGSLAELGYGLHVAHRLQYLTVEQHAEFDSAVRQVAAPLHGLIEHLRREVRSLRRR